MNSKISFKEKGIKSQRFVTSINFNCLNIWKAWCNIFHTLFSLLGRKSLKNNKQTPARLLARKFYDKPF